MPAVLVSIKNVTKLFAGTPALNGVSLDIAQGEVLGIVGENGAGKSTLIKILAGVHRPDSGAIQVQGQPVSFRSPREALRAGIATIHQELAYFEKLTVAENLLMEEPWPRRPWGAIDWTQLYETAARRLAAFDLSLTPSALFHTLSPAQRQEISILRALSRNARLLILDEPTASLTAPEVRRLMLRLQQLKSEGVTILYVSHRLDEILDLTDRVAVLRDGRLVSVFPTAEATIQRLVKEMVGRELAQTEQSLDPARGKPLLRVEGLSRDGLFRDISFTLHAGEVLGLGGLVGAGRSELARAIFGLYPPHSGEMFLRDQPWAPSNPRDSQAAGVAYVPEERKRQGFVLDHSTASAISIGFLGQLGSWGLVSFTRERSRVAQAFSRFSIRARSTEQPVGTLSGGNQQKALLARWLENDPEVILLDEPTRGVDVGANAEIYKLIHSLAATGKGILLISSDMPELLSLSHRILVMHRGAITAEFPAAAATQENILLAASGFARSAV